MDPPNDNIFYVREELREIIICFKEFEKTTSDVPFTREKIQEVNKQRLAFHFWLQKSIAQSSKFEIYATSIIEYIQVLDDPIFDSGRIIGVLETLSENARTNLEETQQISREYEGIKNKLLKINEEYFDHDVKNMKELKLLTEKEEKLKELKEVNLKLFDVISFTGGVIFVICGIGSHMGAFIMIGIIVLILSVIFYFIKRNTETKIRNVKNEIRELKVLEELSILSKEEKDNIGLLCNKLPNVITQLQSFGTYWEIQRAMLDHLIVNLKSERDNLQRNGNQNALADQCRRMLAQPIRNSWERVKVQCDDYIRSVRGLLAETART